MTNGLHHGSLDAVLVFELMATEVCPSKSAHHLQSTAIICRELTLHEQLWIFAALRPEFDFSLIHWLETGRQLWLALVAIQCSARILPLSLLHATSSPFVALELVCSTRTESRLLVDVIGVFRNAEVIVLCRLSPLIERVLSTLHVLSWLDLFIGLETTADGSACASDYLFSTWLENAWKFYTFSFLAHINAPCSFLKSSQAFLSDVFQRSDLTVATYLE